MAFLAVNGLGRTLVLRIVAVMYVALFAAAQRRAWATVNKDDGGGRKSGSGRGKDTGHPAAHKGGKKGGEASASRSAAERSASARKAAATCKRNAEHHPHH
ncbi:hypothetical protein [Caulobacter flavus]|uniref:hypothetical protein n=1 Tax=Caulobacter flavus TaxID=1679497 RepID=UPI001F0BEBC7|nr:hypothetical protein [Caulobacter flavus]